MKNEEVKNRLAYTGNTILAVIPTEEDDIFEDEGFDIIEILPDIKDVKEIHNEHGHLIVVYFADNTSEKAVLHPEDSFNFEQGVSICITKKLLSDLTYGNGSSIYNKLIKHCLKVYKNNRQNEEMLNKMRIEAERREAKERERQEKKAERRKQRTHDELVSIFKESFKSAMIELLEDNVNSNNETQWEF